MKLELYPTFESVFTDEQLKGVFYPLCSLTLDKYPNEVFHFISSNGLWMDENFETENNTFNYTLFEIIGNKYKFNGNIKLYKGSEKAKNIFEKLQNDFVLNGKHYLENKIQTDDYINKQKQNLHIPTDDEFDVDYYIQTFYEFSINKLNFELNNEFGLFRYKMEKYWSKPDKESPIIYEISSENSSSFADIEMNSEYLFPKSISLSKFEKIGQVIGFEFFTDGNDSILLYNKNDKTILSINSYS